jgi:hypothetical protein
VVLRTPLIAAGVAAVLFVTNPTMDEYASWLGQEAIGAGPAGEHQLGKALVAIFGGPLIAANTERGNFILFSIFTTQIDARNRFVAIGVLRNFIPISGLATAGDGPPAPHIVTAGVADRWRPEDGYIWVVNPPQPGDLRVRWQPGMPSSQHPHVVASSVEGRWLPADGYVWVADPPPPGDFRVLWRPGRLSLLHPHVIAANAEGRWLPQDGYVWQADPSQAGGSFIVNWQSGRFSTTYPHVVSAPTEGQWLPEPGYIWVVNPPLAGDLRVKPVGS